jgi:hypothetical protein
MMELIIATGEALVRIEPRNGPAVLRTGGEAILVAE